MLLALLLLQGAATTPIERPLLAAELVATRLPAAATVIDGRLDEPGWAATPVAGGFTQFSPAPGAPASEATEVRALYTATDLYVALRMFDREPGRIDRRLARRDEGGPSDWAWLVIDGDRDRRTAYHFGVNAAGARIDGYRYNDNEYDGSWDGVWEVAVRRDSLGWTAEFRIPFAQLQLAPDAAGRIGFNVGRRIFRKNEVAYWRPVPPGVPAFVSLAGDLAGFDGVRAGPDIQVTPYLVGSSTSSSTGADLRASLPLGFRLTAAVNPDFGQVEADPSQVNLGAGELFLGERRPFFSSGMDQFQFGVAPDRGNQEGLFYSRRLGRAPQLGTGPAATRILAAAKIAGRSSGGYTTALLAAVTAQEEGAGGTIVEPRTTSVFARAGRDLRDGLTSLAFVGTLLRRDDVPEAASLRRAAYTGGVQFHHRFNSDRNALRLNLTASRVEGTAEAITRTQRSAVHYFQRPDAPYGGVDSSATSLMGWAAAVHLDDHAGAWRWNTDWQSRSPGLETNDLGYLRSAALHSWQVAGARYWGTPGRFAREATLRAGSNGELQWDGTRTNAALFATANVTLPSFWTLTAEAWHRVGGIWPTSLRGGPGLRYGGNFFAILNVGTDNRGSLRGLLFTNGWTYYDGESRGFEIEPTLSWRPAGGRELSIGPSYSLTEEAMQWAGRGIDDGSQEVTGRLRQTTLGVTLRATVAFTPGLTLQGYAEPFLSNARWNGFERIVAPRARRTADRGVDLSVRETGGTYAGDLDGNGSFETPLAAEEGRTARLNANAVLRWEYRPGSTFFLVWQHGRESYRTGGAATLGSGLRSLGEVRAQDALIAKLSYWFTL